MSKLDKDIFQFVSESFIHINVYDKLVEDGRFVGAIKTDLIDGKVVLTLSSIEEIDLERLMVLCEKMNKIKLFYESEKPRLVKVLSSINQQM